MTPISRTRVIGARSGKAAVVDFSSARPTDRNRPFFAARHPSGIKHPIAPLLSVRQWALPPPLGTASNACEERDILQCANDDARIGIEPHTPRAASRPVPPPIDRRTCA
uniref:Uncharacterized protein n=1 Tax=Odontella aurita TaxID=265563 RepID=A0A7S4ILB9_9STRA